jgi:hypothetical protein
MRDRAGWLEGTGYPGAAKFVRELEDIQRWAYKNEWKASKTVEAARAWLDLFEQKNYIETYNIVHWKFKRDNSEYYQVHIMPNSWPSICGVLIKIRNPAMYLLNSEKKLHASAKSFVYESDILVKVKVADRTKIIPFETA